MATRLPRLVSNGSKPHLVSDLDVASRPLGRDQVYVQVSFNRAYGILDVYNGYLPCGSGFRV